MALNHGLIGSSFPAIRTYEVSSQKIQEFASAVGETSSACHDTAAARALGYEDVVAPPTFIAVVTTPAMDAVLFHPSLGTAAHDRLVHREERSVSHRPIVAGDRLRVDVHVARIAELKGSQLVMLRAETYSASCGARVATTTTTLLVGGP